VRRWRRAGLSLSVPSATRRRRAGRCHWRFAALTRSGLSRPSARASPGIHSSSTASTTASALSAATSAMNRQLLVTITLLLLFAAVADAHTTQATPPGPPPRPSPYPGPPPPPPRAGEPAV